MLIAARGYCCENRSMTAGSKPASVTVRTKDGREFNNVVMYPKGNPQNPLTEEEFEAKYTDMAARVLGDKQAALLYERARRLPDEDDVADLALLFSPQ